MNERICLLVVDLATHAADIDIDDVGGGIEVQISDMLQKHDARHHLAGIADQILEKMEFAGQQLDFAAGTARGARYEVEREVADPEHRFLGRRLAAAGQGLDAGQQFREGKRLYEVIVAAGAQAVHPIIDAAKRAENQCRRDDAVNDLIAQWDQLDASQNDLCSAVI
jgi:hypothetical protein